MPVHILDTLAWRNDWVSRLRRLTLGRLLQSLLLSLSVLCGQTALAQAAVSEYEEQGQLLRSSQKVPAQGPELFGDQVSLYNGAVEFSQTDLDLPGNSKLPLHVVRRYSTGAARVATGHFGDWDLELPQIRGVFSKVNGWDVSDANDAPALRTKRCTLFSAPSAAKTQTRQALVPPEDFWQGTHLRVPGAGEMELLQRVAGGTPAPADGLAYPLLTKAGWALRCLPNLRHGDGEGFVALAPDGTQYLFDWLVARAHPSLQFSVSLRGADLASAGGIHANGKSPQMTGAPDDQPRVAMGQLLARQEYFLFPTEVSDRFGNWVRYQFNPANPWQLLAITASDGRAVNFTYNGGTGGLVQTVSTGGRQWRYTYSGNTLVAVTRPDGSSWAYSGANLQFNPRFIEAPRYCLAAGSVVGSALVRTMVHPSGARGDFALAQVVRGRSHVAPSCPTPMGSMTNWYPVFYPALALARKTISGPGLPAQTWTYQWGPANGSVRPCSTCPDTVTLDVVDPRGHTTRYTHGNRWNVNEGQLLRVDEGWTGSTALRSTAYRYHAPQAGPYPDPAGMPITGRGDSWMASRHTPLDQRLTSQQAASFQWEATAFSTWAKPTGERSWSSLGFTRSRSIAYHDNLARWVLGQVRSVVDSSLPGQPMLVHDYDPATALPVARWAFGLKQESFSYHPDGNLHARVDAGGRATYHLNYKLGLPQNVVHADGTTEAVTVNDRGLITSHTNAAGTTRQFSHDTMDRLATVVHPTESWGSYHPTLFSLEQVAVAEQGVPAGHWRQTIATGQARTVRVFDALWRPLLETQVDLSRPDSTRSEVQRRWDIDGRMVFESRPQRAISAFDSVLPGRAWAYDALGRETLHTQDSELGPLRTTTAHLPGLQQRVTNPRGHATTLSFQAFDRPQDAAIIGVQAPEGVSVAISRDVFDKAVSVARGGAGLSVVRRYVYDAHQRLCKTIEPESGATVQAYDAAGNIAWTASGLSLPGTGSCDHAAAPALRKVHHSHDARNRLLDTVHGDGSPSVQRRYTPDGLLQQIVSLDPVNPITWNYSWNKRRLLVGEQRVWWPGVVGPGQGWVFSHGIDAYGHVATQSDPWGVVSLAPDALGQPTQVSGYASEVRHHPDGSLEGYTLANGIRHSVEQNLRGMPALWQHSGVVRDRLSYDANGNVSAIVDELGGGTTRSMSQYDGLDRLTRADGPWGSASFSYDTLDNLVASTVGARWLNHQFDRVTNRLVGLSGSQSMGIDYDANGNVAARGTQRFQFDVGNRMQAAVGLASYVYDGHGRRSIVHQAGGVDRHQAYTLDGKLRFEYRPNEGHRRHVYLGGRVIAQTYDDGSVLAVHTDMLGSPVARSNAAGAVVSRTRYEPFGATLAGSTVPLDLGYTGHANDPETGLVYMQQRYYDPTAGRFLSVDPVVADAKTGRSFNRYAYAENNPYRYTDPDGRDTNPVTGESRILDRDLRTNASNPDVGKFGFTRSAANWNKGFHGGVDLRAPVGTDLKASISGVVTATKDFEGSKEGNMVTISGSGDNKGVSVSMMHLSGMSVKSGDKISEGQVIGKSGDSGNAKGLPGAEAHVHMSVKVEGKTVDPQAHFNRQKENY